MGRRSTLAYLVLDADKYQYTWNRAQELEKTNFRPEFAFCSSLSSTRMVFPANWPVVKVMGRPGCLRDAPSFAPSLWCRS